MQTMLVWGIELGILWIPLEVPTTWPSPRVVLVILDPTPYHLPNVPSFGEDIKHYFGFNGIIE